MFARHYQMNEAKIDPNDEYETPPKALTPLLHFLPKDKVIWECAPFRSKPTKDGKLVSALRKAGYKVRAKRIDFLTYHPCRLWLPRYEPKRPLGEVIVTNPPGSLKGKFVQTAYALGLPFAFLMPYYAFESCARLFCWHGLEILHMNRVHYFRPDGGQSDAPFHSAWFCWKLGVGKPHVWAG